MNIITQNCVGGRIYKDILKCPYSNPFIWTVIDFNSMQYLIENWGNINFLNYELVKDDRWNFSIIIDKTVKLQLVHYKFNPNYSTPTRTGPGDISYNKIWEFITEHYETRVNRMLSEKSEPIFCICNIGSIFKDSIYTEDQLNILSKNKNVIIVRGQEKTSPLESAINSFKEILAHEKRVH